MIGSGPISHSVPPWGNTHEQKMETQLSFIGEAVVALTRATEKLVEVMERIEKKGQKK
jgi:hypothetical protein